MVVHAHWYWRNVQDKIKCILGMVLPFAARFIDCATGPLEHTKMIRQNTRYQNLVYFWSQYKRVACSDGFLERGAKAHYKIFKPLLKGMLDERCKEGLCILKFHFLDHVVEYRKRFDSLRLLHALHFEGSCCISRAYPKLIYRGEVRQW